MTVLGNLVKEDVAGNPIFTAPNGAFLPDVNRTLTQVAELSAAQLFGVSTSEFSGQGDTLGDAIVALMRISRNKMIIDPVTGLITIYEDDDTTVMFQANVYESTDTSQAYRGQGVQRRERLT